MPEHYTKLTFQAFAWCNVCYKNTLHRVHDRRLGSCMNEHPHPVKQEKPAAPEDTQGRLFG
jgi:hypothetical protein